jgi:hypothetical protein
LRAYSFFWQIFYQHGLVDLKPGHLTPRTIARWLRELCEWTLKLDTYQLGPSSNWSSSLADMTITAISIIKEGSAPWARGARDEVMYAEIKQELREAVYLAISALTMVSSSA